MKRKLVMFAATLLILFGVYQLGERKVHAQAQLLQTVPLSYGHCLGYVHVGGGDALLFQANDLSLRIVNLETSQTRVIQRTRP
jgi:hypothetical protein